MAGLGKGLFWLPWCDKGVPREIPGGHVQVVQQLRGL